MDTREALLDAFDRFSNQEIADACEVEYNTAAAWRFKFMRNMLSLEKQIYILDQLNYQIKTYLTWKQSKKAR